MILNKTLKELLDRYPDDAAIEAYEGEGTGLIVRHAELSAWINAGPEAREDKQNENDLKLT